MRTFAAPFRDPHFATTPEYPPPPRPPQPLVWPLPWPRYPAPSHPPDHPTTRGTCTRLRLKLRSVVVIQRRILDQFSLKLNLFEKGQAARYSTLKVAAKWGFARWSPNSAQFLLHFATTKFGENRPTRGLSFLQSARRGSECHKPGPCKEQRPRQIRNQRPKLDTKWSQK